MKNQNKIKKLTLVLGLFSIININQNYALAGIFDGVDVNEKPTNSDSIINETSGNSGSEIIHERLERSLKDIKLENDRSLDDFRGQAKSILSSITADDVKDVQAISSHEFDAGVNNYYEKFGKLESNFLNELMKSLGSIDDALILEAQKKSDMLKLDGIAKSTEKFSKDLKEVYGVSMKEITSLFSNGAQVRNDGEPIAAEIAKRFSENAANTISSQYPDFKNDIQKSFNANANGHNANATGHTEQTISGGVIAAIAKAQSQ